MEELTFDDLIPAEKKAPQPLTFDDLIPQQPSVVEDVLKSGASGLVKGVHGLFGVAGDLDEMARSAGLFLGNAARRMTGKEPIDPAQMPGRLLKGVAPTSVELQEKTGFTPYAPKTTAGRYVDTAASFVPAAAAAAFTGGTSLVPTVARLGVVPGLVSEAAGQATEGSAFEPYARIAGALVGPAAATGLRRVVTPFPTNATRQQAVKTLRAEGVDDITAGQATGSHKLRYMESELGGRRVEEVLENQGEQFTRAALRRIGEDAPRATTDVLRRANDRIGNSFNRLARNNTLVPDQQMGADLGAAVSWYAGRVRQPNQAPIIRNYVAEIRDALKGGTISGEAYQSLRSRIRDDARSSGGDQYVQSTLNDIADALDDTMERSIAANNPADLGAWREARDQYRNYLVIERAVTGGGEAAAGGLVTPAQLRVAAVGQGRRAYATGRNEYSDLAHAGAHVMAPLPNSGTTSRTAARALVQGVPASIGGLFGHTLGGGDITPIVAGLAAGAAVPAGIGRAILSAPGRGYLTNQLIPGPARRAPWDALAASLENATLEDRLRRETPQALQ